MARVLDFCCTPAPACTLHLSASRSNTCVHAGLPAPAPSTRRQHIEESMGSVREEMNLLSDLDGSSGGGEWAQRRACHGASTLLLLLPLLQQEAELRSER